MRENNAEFFFTIQQCQHTGNIVRRELHHCQIVTDFYSGLIRWEEGCTLLGPVLFADQRGQSLKLPPWKSRSGTFNQKVSS